MLMNYFTSFSVEKNPYFLRKEYNNKLINSFLKLLDAISKGLKKDFSALILSLNEVKHAEKLKPEFHALYDSLLNSVKNKNIELILKNINKLESIIKNVTTLFSINTLSQNEWENEILEDLRKQNEDVTGNLPELSAVEKSQIELYLPYITNSINLIKEADSLFFNEYSHYVSEIKLFSSNLLVGMTDPRVYGTIFIATPPKNVDPEIYFCEHIIHETSHLHLYTLFALDPLILNDPEERFSAPIRPDPRPMYGIFHATFVLSRMVRIFKKISSMKDKEKYLEFFELFHSQFKNGYETIKNHGKLTKFGKNIFESYDDILKV